MSRPGAGGETGPNKKGGKWRWKISKKVETPKEDSYEIPDFPVSDRWLMRVAFVVMGAALATIALATVVLGYRIATLIRGILGS